MYIVDSADEAKLSEAHDELKVVFIASYPSAILNTDKTQQSKMLIMVFCAQALLDNHDLRSIPLLVLFNKNDLIKALPPETLIKAL